MIQLYQLDNSYHFPSAEQSLAEPNGLIAFGGDLSMGRLVSAYQQGIFPWFNPGEPLLWWCPDPRAVLPLDSFHRSRSLLKLLRQQRYTFSINRAFERVILACATVPRVQPNSETGELAGTWITDQMTDAYIQLHHAGVAHSIEVWDQRELVGGLYGVAVGGVFCGESMFHRVPNASKLAFSALVSHMQSYDLDFIDCQLENPHLRRLGCKTIARKDFLRALHISRQRKLPTELWDAQTLHHVVAQ
ncbi:leucyl/phenylalanyl-tRNA--protein transferase [Alteromonas oceanisediminis]|uniref:leucyl/phenylalanyl-tRNA--protein transferase n=1 Tax=Alteromonas oceanisediminis TaxID=2836180 RepID=UPI001BDAE5FF|nr:leucyl/phenylalanyl-tRNA--protein transferase [Alteromonas oceanisediminis]MBT0586573.1 leucyl/phenylalanyl-tRNA--protein transferase [Alteromonas oceanisediminis]